MAKTDPEYLNDTRVNPKKIVDTIKEVRRKQREAESIDSTDSTLTIGMTDTSNDWVAWPQWQQGPRPLIDDNNPTGDVAADAPKLAQLVRYSEGSSGRLRIGAFLHRYHRDGRDLGSIRKYLQEEEGVSLPSASRCTVYRKAYEAWLTRPLRSAHHGEAQDDANYVSIGSPEMPIWLHDGSVVRLADFPIDKLYLLRNELGTSELEQLLALARDSNEHQIREYVKGDSIANEDPEKPISEVATIKLPRVLYEQMEAFVERLRAVTGKHDLTWGVALEFMLGQFSSDDISDQTLDYLWRSAHGELTEEEVEELEREYYTVA